MERGAGGSEEASENLTSSVRRRCVGGEGERVGARQRNGMEGEGREIGGSWEEPWEMTR